MVPFVIFTQLISVLILFPSTSFAATDKVLCYYESWSAVRPENLDVNICTHIIYSFFGVNATSGALRLDGYDDILKRLAALKNKNPNLKLLISVGGWAEPPKGFSDVAKDPVKRQAMAESALSYIKKYNFDGLDVDWEYPSKRGGISEDKENFVELLKVLREAFDQNGGYLLTSAVWALVEPNTYDVPEISKHVHYINVMTYDLHSTLENKTGQNSPLYAASTDTDYEKKNLNCNASITNWIEAGAPAEKLLLGLAFYGHSFKLADPAKHKVNDKSIGSGSAGSSYKEVCRLRAGWNEAWDDEQKNPYKYSYSQWIGYDNPRSIGLKVQFAKEKKLGGVMMWALDEDDRTGACGSKWPLLNAIKENL